MVKCNCSVIGLLGLTLWTNVLPPIGRIPSAFNKVGFYQLRLTQFTAVIVWGGNAEGEPNQSIFRCDAAVCAEQKMEKEVNAV